MGEITTTTSGKSPLHTIRDFLTAKQEALEVAIPKAARRDLSTEYAISTVLGSISQRPELQTCSALSVYQSVHRALTLGIQPEGALGHAYLVPFWNKKRQCNEAQLIIGYRGLTHLAVRSGACVWLRAFVVREGDEWDCSHGDGGRVFYRASNEPLEERERLGVLAMAKLPDGEVMGEFMPAAEVLKRKAVSKTADRSMMWTTFEDEGWMKTGVRHLAKQLPISNTGAAREFTQAAYEDDEAPKDAEVMSVRSEPKPDPSSLDDLLAAARAEPATCPECGRAECQTTCPNAEPPEDDS